MFLHKELHIEIKFAAGELEDQGTKPQLGLLCWMWYGQASEVED